MTTVNVKSVLSQSTRANFEHHCGTLAWSMIILLHGISDTLAGGKVDGTLACNRECSRSALSRMFSFGFDRDFLLAEYIKFA